MSWPTVTLGDVCEIISGSTPSTNIKEYWGDDFYWATPKDLSSLKSKTISATQRKITPAGLKSCGASLLPIGSVLLSSRAPIGLIAINSVELATNQGFKSLIPNTLTIDASYLYYWLQKNRKHIDAMGVGATFKEISKSIVSKIQIPLPPLPEQKRIAAILDKADEIRRKREAAIAKLDQLAQSIFVEMFGDSGHFPQKPLSSICELITDGTHYTPTYADDGFVFLSAKNVTSGCIDWDNIKYVPETLHEELQKRVSPKVGDVLMAKNGTTGVAAIVDRDIVFDIYVSLALLRPSKLILSSYLHAALNSPIAKKQFNAALKGIGVPNLHLVEIRNAVIPLPPLALQEEFSCRISKLENLKADNKAALAKQNNLFSSLQHAAFSGQL